jgi:hypothetical protein
MLTRTLARTGIVIAGALILAGSWQTAASASGTPGGGAFGGTQCGQDYTPGCTVTAGTPGSGGTGTKGSTSANGTGTGTIPAGRSGSGCAGTDSKAFGCVPPGCTITVQTLACPVGGGAPAGGGRAPAPPPPAVLARLAVRYLRLPDPMIQSSPAPGALQLTRLPVWLWVADVWQPQSKTAQVPGESVTATAAPVSAAWSMGDGTTITCTGPGTPYGGTNPAAASPTCGHTYQESSAGQPGGAYRVTVTITWDITWKGTRGAGGVLAPLETVTAAEFRVAESQALNTSSGG